MYIPSHPTQEVLNKYWMNKHSTNIKWIAELGAERVSCLRPLGFHQTGSLLIVCKYFLLPIIILFLSWDFSNMYVWLFGLSPIFPNNSSFFSGLFLCIFLSGKCLLEYFKSLTHSSTLKSSVKPHQGGFHFSYHTVQFQNLHFFFL